MRNRAGGITCRRPPSQWASKTMRIGLQSRCRRIIDKSFFNTTANLRSVCTRHMSGTSRWQDPVQGRDRQTLLATDPKNQRVHLASETAICRQGQVGYQAGARRGCRSLRGVRGTLCTQRRGSDQGKGLQKEA